MLFLDAFFVTTQVCQTFRNARNRDITFALNSPKYIPLVKNIALPKILPVQNYSPENIINLKRHR